MLKGPSLVTVPSTWLWQLHLIVYAAQANVTYAINWVVAAFFSLDLGLRLVAQGFLLTPTAYMHVSIVQELGALPCPYVVDT